MIPCRVIENRPLSPIYHYLKLEVLDRNRFAYPKPFQFITIWVPRVDELPMSIAGFYEDSYVIEVLYKIVGLGTKSLANAKVGSFLGIKGPLGRAYPLEELGKKVLAICGGTGLAPLALLAQLGKSLGISVDLIWGVKRSMDIGDVLKVFGNRFSKVIVATEDCSYGVCGTVIEALNEVNLDSYDSIVVAGPVAMEKRLCAILSNYDPVVILEAMVKCGLGMCGSCVLRPLPKLLCVDGPAFRCSEVKPYLESYKP